MARDTLYAIGEALIDMIPSKSGCAFAEVPAFSPRVGGAPANVCGAFTKLGGASALLTQLGDDPFGHSQHRAGLCLSGSRRQPHFQLLPQAVGGPALRAGTGGHHPV